MSARGEFKVTDVVMETLLSCQGVKKVTKHATTTTTTPKKTITITLQRKIILLHLLHALELISLKYLETVASTKLPTDKFSAQKSISHRLS